MDSDSAKFPPHGGMSPTATGGKAVDLPNQLISATNASPPRFASAPRTGGTNAADLYNTDYYAWTQKIKQALQSRAYDSLDVVNLIEEVEDMGKNVRRGLRSHLANLLMHLLKWQYQSHIQSHSWRASIAYARDGVIEELDDNPSLKPEWELFLAKAYRTARFEAVKETNLPLKTFPEVCPYTHVQILDEDWLPA